ncbi:MAG: uncharacterized protein KVP18_002264 [Porospora cf. gigantea A]|uniref:uncharacterized protein n=1 Tax=Porospora cf. gigantea A TaxID=2853593 RepID=UPI00355976FB|nr:MAG: hypothetical protein KVP18_002264 [Porospora cf. gigantea A]
MIRVWASDQWHHTLIDCGKTFRDAVLNVFHPLGIAHVDEVLLTHGHKDACGGLDDLRDLQNFSMTPEREYRVSSPLTVVSDHATVMEVQRQFSYMCRPVRVVAMQLTLRSALARRLTAPTL